MRGYYIYFNNGPLGVNLRKKINSQIDIMRKYCEVKEIQINEREVPVTKRILDKLPFISIDKWETDEVFQIIQEPDFLYVRRNRADRRYVNFFHMIKQKYPQCKVIIEIYTYPFYKDEYASPKRWPNLIKEVYYNKKLKSCVDRFTTYSADTEIWGVKAMPQSNGINVNDFCIVRHRRPDDEIHLIAVAMFQKHHGYERILNALADYIEAGGKRKLKITMVGEGAELEYYEELIAQRKLESYVYLTGRKQGKALDALYSDADIALGSFGMYKIGLKNGSILKIREYLAKGLPVISGVIDYSLTHSGKPFYLEVENNEKTVVLETVIQFYDKNYGGKNQMQCNELHQEIRKYAEKTVSLDKTFEPVIKYIRGD